MAKRFAFLSLILALACLAFAQDGGKKKAPAEKSVSGIVTDEHEKPVPGAVVKLKNTRTLQIRSFIARDMGDYYFNGLATDVDYELKAEANGQSSAPHVLSLFDTHNEARVNLQLKP
jgi:Carboxypeptidase regulatory-like domain